jgi:hypothetical protein
MIMTKKNCKKGLLIFSTNVFYVCNKSYCNLCYFLLSMTNFMKEIFVGLFPSPLWCAMHAAVTTQGRRLANLAIQLSGSS